ncbi:hypothetical protein Tco_0550277 [Tanacetum coccineum]
MIDTAHEEVESIWRVLLAAPQKAEPARGGRANQLLIRPHGEREGGCNVDGWVILTFYSFRWLSSCDDPLRARRIYFPSLKFPTTASILASTPSRCTIIMGHPPLLYSSTDHKRGHNRVTLPPQKECRSLSRMIEFETRVRRDTDKVYTRLDDEQTGRQLLAGRLNMLFRDRRAHARTTRLMETEARISNSQRFREDSEDSTVTYTAVSSPFGGLSDIGSPGIPSSPNYVLGHPPSTEFVPEHVYLEFMPSEDDVLLDEEHPLPAATSPTTDLPGYVPESNPEEDPEEDDDEDPKEDPADYPADRGDNSDNEDESSDDDEDDDSVDHAPFAEETEPFVTDESAATPPPHPVYWVTARISIRDEPPIPFWSDTEVARLLAIPTPPPSPLSPWSSPLPQIPSPPLPVSPPLPLAPPPLPVSPTYPLGYRAAMIRLRAEAPSTSHSPPPHIILSHTRADTPPSGTPPSGTPPLLPIPLPTSSPPLHLPSADHGADRPEVCLPPRKRLCIALGPRYEVGESSSAAAARPTGGFRADYGFVATMDREIMRDLERDVGYGITDTWDEMLVDMPGAPATDDTELGRRMTEFATRVRQDTDEIYVRLDDEQTERQLMAGRLNMLYRDRRAHARTALLMEREARMSREA